MLHCCGVGIRIPLLVELDFGWVKGGSNGVLCQVKMLLELFWVVEVLWFVELVELRMHFFHISRHSLKFYNLEQLVYSLFIIALAGRNHEEITIKMKCGTSSWWPYRKRWWIPNTRYSKSERKRSNRRVWFGNRSRLFSGESWRSRDVRLSRHREVYVKMKSLCMLDRHGCADSCDDRSVWTLSM